MAKIYKSVLDTLNRKRKEGEEVYFTYLSSLLDLYTPSDKYVLDDKKPAVLNLFSLYLLSTPILSMTQMFDFLDRDYVFQEKILPTRVLVSAIPFYESWKMRGELPECQVKIINQKNKRL